ncbi:MAG: response regulator [Akkermansiaceae bacterium]|nr:response regulator [Akkermansiaceae bacterium]
MKSEAYRNQAAAGAFDLVIYDRCVPVNAQDATKPGELPQANTLFVGVCLCACTLAAIVFVMLYALRIKRRPESSIVADRRDYQVAVAHNIADAQGIAGTFGPNVALLDVNLGRENGLTLITTLKDILPDIVCVVITARSDVEHAIDAIRRGAFDYLLKPLHPLETLSRLEKCFDKIALQQRAEGDGASMAGALNTGPRPKLQLVCRSPCAFLQGQHNLGRESDKTLFPMCCH